MEDNTLFTYPSPYEAPKFNDVEAPSIQPRIESAANVDANASHHQSLPVCSVVVPCGPTFYGQPLAQSMGMQQFSPMPTSALSFSEPRAVQASDGLSAYELQRLENIRRNEATLASMNISPLNKVKPKTDKRKHAAAGAAPAKRARSARDVAAPESYDEATEEELPIGPFASCPLAVAHQVVELFDAALLVQGQRVAFGAIKNKATPRQWVVGTISAIDHSKVHWARVREFGNREFAFATVDGSLSSYGQDWHFLGNTPWHGRALAADRCA